MRDLSGGEAEVAEDDVLDAVLEEVAALRGRHLGLLVEQVQDHGQVVDSERPERVLVRADDAEVLAVAVDAEHLAQLASVDQLLQLLDARVVEQQMAGHQDEVALRGEPDQLVHLGCAHRGRLLDEHVLAGRQRLLRQLVVSRHRRGDHYGLKCLVGQHFVESRGGFRLRKPSSEQRQLFRGHVAQPREVGEVVEVAREVRSPVAEPGDADPRHSFQTFPSTSAPLVAFRKSTITSARRTTSA